MNVEQEKQMKMMSNVMIVIISLASFSLPTTIGLYWIFNSGFTICQNIIIKGGKNMLEVYKFEDKNKDEALKKGLEEISKKKTRFLYD